MKKLFKIAFALTVLLLSLCVPVVVGATEKAPVHTVTIYDGSDPIACIAVPHGDRLTSFPSPVREGYKLVGWRVGGADGELFEPASPITEDISLYAVYELLPPRFEISSLAFTYDGRAHTLAFSSLSHPLLECGILSYEWLRNGISLGAYGASLSLTNVSDSGEYSCRLVFSVGGDVAEITTPALTVTISKAVVPLPNISPLYYTADLQAPPIYDNGYYTVDRTPRTLAGTYPVTLTLTDPDNYSFPGTDRPSTSVDMVILPAANYWVVAPNVSDVYESFAPMPSALSRFGTPTFLYSRDGAEYTADPPTAPGRYFMRAVVDGCENYSALVSDPVELVVMPEHVVGIAVITEADKMTYRAFDYFDSTGLVVGVTYNSGRYETVGAEALAISYQQADSFRYRDSGVIITYGGASVLLRTTVTRADYDLSDIALSDMSATYSGIFIGSSFSGVLPVGLDGIPLSAALSGGGTDVGVYTLTLSFSTTSDNYNTPQPMTAVLTILPYRATVTWSNLTFVYDGIMKLPSAYYLDVHGRRIALSPVGAHSFAGVYTATVSIDDPNYAFEDPSVTYEILRADYDMSAVVWQGSGLTYDGGEKSVSLVGLPDGVVVIGYVNSTAVAAGEYTATAALSYDSVNYNPPIVPTYTWCILPASYSTDGFTFSDLTATYDGLPHYPVLNGLMPVGIDGITLEYSFSASVTHVADGRTAIEVIFTTKSTNYTPPQPIVCYAEITPLDITVVWQNSEFRYTGATLLPTATSELCQISVSGGGIDAGEHTATALSLDPDYRVANDTFTYVIHKADNCWILLPTVSDVFFGRAPMPSATALAGEVEYTYYRDAECTAPVDGTPTSVGIYFVIAHSSGDKNHEPITSSAVALEIIAITPIALDVLLDRAEYTALDSLTFSASLINNDGSRTPIDSALVGVRYQSGDVLLFGDTGATFSYSDLTCSRALSVVKRVVPIPTLTPVEYDGTPHIAIVPDSPLYTSALTSATHIGTYPVTLTLTDTHNYTFGSSDTATVYFVISPRRITVTVSDVDVYLFERDVTFDWQITEGTLVGADTITPTFRVEDSVILADFDAPCYDVTVIPGRLNHRIGLSARTTSVFFTVFLGFVALTLALIAIITNRHRIASAALMCSTVSPKEESDQPQAPISTDDQPAPSTADLSAMVDAEYADNAITNALAKDLIRHDEDVETSGHRHGIVNVDTLSRSFSAGDRVDINTLKTHSLIPYDTAYVKVLARGMIDKPLYVYANDFSLAAVKMIALSGGKAVKVNTVIRKSNK